MELFRGGGGRRRSTGLLGGVLVLVGAVVMLLFLAALAALALLAMALVGVVMGAERILGLLLPSYRRRRRHSCVTMPTVLVRTVRFGSRPTEVIEAHAHELPRPER